MIICMCNNVSETDIINELKKDKTIVEALSACGVGLCCGCCLQTIKELFDVDKKTLFDYNYNAG